MSKGLLLVATGAVSLVVLLAGSGFTAHESAGPVPGRLVAYDLRSGGVRFDVPSATASASIHTVAPGIIVLTGAESCRRLHAQRPVMSAYSSSGGALLWQRPIPADDACGPQLAARATQGVIGLGSAAGLEGVNATDGATRWRIARIASFPLVTAAGMVATEGAARANRLDFVQARTGRIERSVTVRWMPSAWYATARTAIAWAQRGTVAPRSRLVAIDRASGRRLWQRTLPSSLGLPAGADGVIVESWQTVPPYVADPSQLTAPTPQTVTTAAFDVRTGRRLWHRVTPGGSGLFAENLFSAGSGLALSVRDGMLEALDLHTGAPRWRVPLAPGTNHRYGSIVAGEGAVAVVDGTSVSVLDARDGSTRWSESVSGSGMASIGPAVLADGLLLVPSTSRSFIPFNG